MDEVTCPGFLHLGILLKSIVGWEEVALEACVIAQETGQSLPLGGMFVIKSLSHF